MPATKEGNLFADLNPLLALGLLLLAGLLGGYLAGLVRLPQIIGQIVMGIVLGPYVLRVFGHESVTSFGTVTQFALGFIALTVGEHLNLRTLRNAGKRLFYLLLTESIVTPLFVVAGGLALGGSLAAPLLLSAIAVASAPATAIALVKEARARGVFVKTLTAAVALNSISCIVIFALARNLAAAILGAGEGIGRRFLESATMLGGSVLLGAAAGTLLVAAMRHEVRGSHRAAGSMLGLLLVCGLSLALGLPVLLPCLAMGVAIANLTPRTRDVGTTTLARLEAVVFALFFTLAGMELDFGGLADSGLLALVVLVTRFAGKLVAADLGMRLAGATEKVRRYLGLALVPQAGVAVGLILLVQSDAALAPVRQLVLSAGLAVVIANELIGAFTAHFALRRSGEEGKDRPRLMDFIQEEHILVGLAARSMEEAVRRLVDHMFRTYHLRVDREAFVRSVLEREREASTCLGAGLAVPHGIMEGQRSIVGVMGLSSEGLPLETPDGRPVHCIVMLATPAGERERHLEVMASLNRMVSQDPRAFRELYRSESSAHAHDVLHAEESEDFNYYLTDEEDATGR